MGHTLACSMGGMGHTLACSMGGGWVTHLHVAWGGGSHTCM